MSLTAMCVYVVRGISLGVYKMQTANWHTSPLVSALMLNVGIICHVCCRIPYGMLIHLNSVHIRIMPSVCLIVLTASIVTYGCPSFEWFWQSGDSSNVCSTHPYTQTSLYCVECLCVHFVHVLYDTVSVTGLPFFCSPLMCARKHHLLL